ncbi:hypothetical protein DPMN_027121 [Dreissena polymorpha]|uniref:Uncharacterized protein n=1 Tax=Dreissena polymorpha TaxID=45954 RepID=A0A9D4REY4_DREPO|nr:hypothetical protein DPMN_027121 [Dreissena polymorpha]
MARHESAAERGVRGYPGTSLMEAKHVSVEGEDVLRHPHASLAEARHRLTEGGASVNIGSPLQQRCGTGLQRLKMSASIQMHLQRGLGTK